MHAIRTIFFTLLIYLLLGCSNNSKIKENGKTKIVRIDMDATPKNIHEIGLINKVDILNLHGENVLLGDVSKVIQYNDRLYLLDSESQSVHIYDNSGNFISVISNMGKGPSEYIQLVDILINTDDGNLNLISRIDHKMFSYDLDGKKLLGIKKLPKSFAQVSSTNFGYIGYMGNYIEETTSPQNVWTISKEGELMNGYLNISNGWESFTNKRAWVFSTFLNTAFYTQPMDFNIYALNKDGFSIPYAFDLGRAAWPVEINSLEKMDEMSLADKMRYVQNFDCFQETKKFLITKVLYHGQTRLCIYDKQNDRACSVSLEPYLGEYFFPFGQIVSIDEQAIYTVVDAVNLKRIWDGNDGQNDFEAKYPKQVKRLREKFPNIDVDGSPFLIVYYLN